MKPHLVVNYHSSFQKREREPGCVQGGHNYTYDAENRITQVDGGGTATYVYDVAGRRVSKTAAGSQRDYVYNSGGKVVSEWTPGCGSGCWSAGYVYVGGGMLAQYRNGTTYFVHKDHLGSQRLLTDLSHNNYDSLDFSPFGEQTAGDTGTRYKFTGKERDAESGLDNFGVRYMSSSMGRFMSPDPGGAGAVDSDPQSWNAYSYVRNNPLNLTDPTGEIFCRAANDTERGQGVTQVCDITDAQYVNSSKDQQAAYDKAGYTHFDCSCDTGADKDAWQNRNGNVSNDWIGDALVVGSVFAGVEGFFYPSASSSQGRLSQDENVNPNPPAANNGNGTIGTSPAQRAALNKDIEDAKANGATDIRVNQQQVNAMGERVGINRPDLQYTDRGGIRQYTE